jgi:Amt family ammonium transporter
VSVDQLWVLIAALMVVLMQAGFTCLESGMVRAKNSINVAIKNLVDFCISLLLFALFGYALMYGSSLSGWIGSDGFLLHGVGAAGLVHFFFQAVFCGTATTIVSGAVAERMTFVGYACTAVLLSGLIYPVAGHWVWATDAAGTPVGLLGAQGFIDFAGATVVHSVGGWVALAALLVLGPRIGRFSPKRRPIEGHSLPTAALGVFLLWFGWFGFNGGSAGGWNESVPLIIANTALGGAAGGLAALLGSVWLRGRPLADWVMNGVLAGLVAVTAACHLLSPATAMLAGGVGALVALAAMLLLERFNIDDAIGAVPVHLCAGIWGTLAVALLGDASGFDRWVQLTLQLKGVLLIGLYAFPVALGGMLILRRVVRLRVSARDERIGLNISEHGASTSLLDLISQMDLQASSGDFSRRVQVESESEASSVATFYNTVLDKFNGEIDRRKLAIQRLSELASRDPLTGLANRRMFFDGIQRAFAHGSPAIRGAVLYIDLDGFKEINDSLGHEAGDLLLRAVTVRLAEQAGPDVLIARLGGDEFAILLPQLRDGERQATDLAQTVVNALGTDFELDGQRIRIGASVGVALFSPGPGETVKGVIRRADNAMYMAKLAGKGVYRLEGSDEGGGLAQPVV